MFNIIWSKKALSQMKELPYLISKRIYEKVSQLTSNPLSLNVRRLVGLPYYRLRVGDYRVIFDIQRSELIILIVKVGYRKDIYKR